MPPLATVVPVVVPPLDTISKPPLLTVALTDEPPLETVSLPPVPTVVPLAITLEVISCRRC